MVWTFTRSYDGAVDRQISNWGSMPAGGRWYLAAAVVFSTIAVGGCGDSVPFPQAVLFTVPLAVEGEAVSPAIVDTGGGYEVLLRSGLNLRIIGQADVLAFGGREVVEVTEGFSYSVDGIRTSAPFAIVGLSACDCNGLGFHFFQKTGAILELDFGANRARILSAVPIVGVSLPFQPPPESLPDFNTSFIDVMFVEGRTPAIGGTGRRARALLDTGATLTVVQRDLLADDSLRTGEHVLLSIEQENLGTRTIRAVVFHTPGLPDIILGLDAMRAWSDRWYFAFSPHGGTVTVEVPIGNAFGSRARWLPIESRSRERIERSLRLDPDPHKLFTVTRR